MMTDDRAFEQALDEALHLVAAGVSREDCLRRFPRYAAELAPLLEAAEAARLGLRADQPVPTPNLARGRRRFLKAAQAQRPGLAGLRALRWMAATLALVLVVGWGAGAASANALPGEVLYPVKRGFEALQLALTFEAAARARLQNEQAARRRAEAHAVLNLSREVRVEFEGTVDVVQPDRLQVAGLWVLTGQAGDFQVADEVRVFAQVRRSVLVADHVILVARPAARPTSRPTLVVTSTPNATRAVDTSTAVGPRLTETRRPPTATATATEIRPTQLTLTGTRAAPSATRAPTETPTSERLADTPTREATATVFRPTPTGTPGRP